MLKWIREKVYKTMGVVANMMIWNMAMREHLMVEIAEHIREFRCRVHDNPLARFEYVQMPAVSYVRLKDEVSKV